MTSSSSSSTAATTATYTSSDDPTNPELEQILLDLATLLPQYPTLLTQSPAHLTVTCFHLTLPALSHNTVQWYSSSDRKFTSHLEFSSMQQVYDLPSYTLYERHVMKFRLLQVIDQLFVHCLVSGSGGSETQPTDGEFQKVTWGDDHTGKLPLVDKSIVATLSDSPSQIALLSDYLLTAMVPAVTTMLAAITSSVQRMIDDRVLQDKMLSELQAMYSRMHAAQEQQRAGHSDDADDEAVVQSPTTAICLAIVAALQVDGFTSTASSNDISNQLLQWTDVPIQPVYTVQLYHPALQSLTVQLKLMPMLSDLQVYALCDALPASLRTAMNVNSFIDVNAAASTITPHSYKNLPKLLRVVRNSLTKRLLGRAVHHGQQTEVDDELQTPTLCNLPAELQLNILSLLDSRSLIRTGITCSALNSISNTSTLWQFLCEHELPNQQRTALYPVKQDWKQEYSIRLAMKRKEQQQRLARIEASRSMWFRRDRFPRFPRPDFENPNRPLGPVSFEPPRNPFRPLGPGIFPFRSLQPMG